MDKQELLFNYCVYNNVEELSLLLVGGGVDLNFTYTTEKYLGHTPLMIACIYNYEDIVKLLLEYSGIDYNKVTGGGYNAFMMVCVTGNKKIFDMLIDKSDINSVTNNGYTPLYLACFNNRYEIVKALLSRDVDINKASNNGWTPLMQACYKSYYDITYELLRYKGTDFDRFVH